MTATAAAGMAAVAPASKAVKAAASVASEALSAAEGFHLTPVIRTVMAATEGMEAA